MSSNSSNSNWQSAAIQAGGSVFAEALSFLTQKQQYENQVAANKSLQDYAFQQNVDMWNLQNAYNSPQQQMSRLKKAGLNPNLMYGKGASAGNATQLPKYQSPTAQVAQPKFSMPDMLGMYTNFMLANAQVRNQDAAAEKMHTDENIAHDKFYGYAEKQKGGSFIYHPGEIKYYHKTKFHQMETARHQASLTHQQYQVQREQERMTRANATYRERELNWFIANNLAKLVGIGAGATGLSRIGRTGKFVKGTAPKTYYNAPSNLAPTRRTTTWY